MGYRTTTRAEKSDGRNGSVTLTDVKTITIRRCLYGQLEEEVIECHLHGFGGRK